MGLSFFSLSEKSVMGKGLTILKASEDHLPSLVLQPWLPELGRRSAAILVSLHDLFKFL